MLLPFLFCLFLVLIILGIKFKFFVALKKVLPEKKKVETEKKEKTTLTSGGKKYSLKQIAVVVLLIFAVWVGYSYLKTPKITGSQWQLWWEKDSEKGPAGVFTAKIEKISQDYILLSFPGAKGKMEGKSRDGKFYEGTWNDPRPKKGGKGKWHFRFVSRDLAIGWLSDADEAEKRIIVFQNFQKK
ncbi:MAG: hypothetical protein V1877_00245 [Candidatus Tagabacteria bacterium]